MMPFFLEKWKEAENWMKSVAFPAIQETLFKTTTLKRPFSKALCIDDDRSFCLFIQRLGRSLDIQVDAVYSCEEAKRAIENTEYESFIIDGHLPDGSGFELVAWIREKKGLTIPIGFISRIYQDAASFRILKDSLKVDYVLEKPIRPSEVYQLLRQLSHLQPQPTVSQPVSDHLLADLKENYQKTIPDKIERLEKIILAIQKNPAIENLQLLKLEVHKIAGSAGSYGYPAVSEICKNLELDLIKQMALAKQGTLNPYWFFSLDDFFTQIKLFFQIEPSESHFHHLQRFRYLPFVYIIDDDPAGSALLEASKSDLPFNILIEPRPDRAIQTLVTADFFPQIFLVKRSYPSSILNGYDLIQAFYHKHDSSTTTTGIMVDGKSLEEPAEALLQGMTWIADTSFPPSLLLSFLDQIPFRALPLPYHVMAIDDDPDVCQYILKTLKYTGLDVQTIDDIQNVEVMISQTQPDLILLDIHLIDEFGIRLLEKIRNVLKYKKLLIGILTITEKETYLLQKCYELNVDEIIFKPLEAGVLQRKVAYLLQKQAYREVFEAPKIAPELEHRKTFERYLNKLQQEPHIPFPKVLCLFEFENFGSFVQEDQEEILLLVSKHLEKLLRKHEMASYLGEGRFALIFQGYDPYFVRLFMHYCLDQLRLQMQKRFPLDIQINGNLFVLPKGEQGEQIFQRGDDFLSEIRKLPNREPVQLNVSAMEPIRREVAIFCDSVSEREGLTNLFKSQDFKVNIFSSWEENSSSFFLSSTLLIFIDSLVEKEGVFILTKLFEQNFSQIPIFCLSHKPQLEELENFFKKIDYFKHPFKLLLWMKV